jgi:hypothetical protein
MIRIVLHISAVAAIFMLISCGASRQDFKEPGLGTEKYKEVAFQKYGSGVEFLFNENRSAVLCLKKTKPTAEHPQRQVAFFVFDFSTDTTIFEDEIANGTVAWKDNSSVLVTTVPGIVKSDDPPGGKLSGYIFDLRSRKTINLDASGVH